MRAKRPVETGNPRELRKPVRGAKGSLAIQTGTERGEFVVKQRVLDPGQPISRERNRENRPGWDAALSITGTA